VSKNTLHAALRNLVQDDADIRFPQRIGIDLMPDVDDVSDDRQGYEVQAAQQDNSTRFGKYQKVLGFRDTGHLRWQVRWAISHDLDALLHRMLRHRSAGLGCGATNEQQQSEHPAADFPQEAIHPKNRSYPARSSTGGGVGKVILPTMRWQM
jgi:hypothetical protein